MNKNNKNHIQHDYCSHQEDHPSAHGIFPKEESCKTLGEQMNEIWQAINQIKKHLGI